MSKPKRIVQGRKRTNKSGDSSPRSSRPLWYVSSLAIPAIAAFSASHARATDTWNTPTGDTWLTTGNWTNLAPPGTTEIGQFAGNPTSNNTKIGINFSISTNNGTANQAAGAVELTSAAAKAITIGDSSSTTPTNGTFTLNGATVVNNSSVSVTDVILHNQSASLLTLQPTSLITGSAGIMSVALGDATNNIIYVEGSGGVTITSNIGQTASGRQLTVEGSGSGVVTLSGTDSFSGGLVAAGGEVDVTNGDAGLGAAGGSITINGGRLAFVTLSTTMDPTRPFFLGSNSTGSNTGGSLSVKSGLSLTYAGTLKDLNGSTHGDLVKQGGGTFIIGGASSYSGNTFLNNGTTQLASGGSLPSTTVLNIGQAASTNLGAFDLNGINQQIAGLTSILGTGTSTTVFNTVTSTNGTPSLTINTAGNSYSYGTNAPANTGIITGSLSLIKAGSGTQSLGGLSTYTGGTTINGGTLQTIAINALPSTGVVTLANTSGVLLDLDTFNQTIGNLAGGGASGGSVALAGATLTAGDASNQTFSGAIADSGGANTSAVGGALIKNGSGILTLSGANSYSGATTINSGALTYSASGSSSGNGSLLVGSSTGTGVFNISTSGTLAYATSIIGNGGAGAVNQSLGTINLTPTPYTQIGDAAYGSYNLSGGTLNTAAATGVHVGYNTSGAAGIGIFTQSAGILNTNRSFVVGGSTGTSSITGGIGVATFVGTATVNAGSAGITVGDNAGSTNVLNLGTLAPGGTPAINVSGAGGLAVLDSNTTAASNSTVNLDSGIVAFSATSSPGINVVLKSGVASLGTATLNLNGATIQAAANNATLISNGGGLAGTVYNGGVVFDTQGNTGTVTASLVSPNIGSGIYAGGTGVLALPAQGTGYIGAPVVTVSGGSGTGATAIANITAGQITGITITNPGTGYTAGQQLTLTFTGGGATAPVASTSYTLLSGDLAANGAGGVTKIGTGTLTFTGANTYTGPTLVSAGTLLLNGTHTGGAQYTIGNGTAFASLGGTGSTTSAVTVSTNSTIEPGSGTGTGTLTAGGLAGSGTFQADVNSLTGANDKAASLIVPNAGGTSAVNLSGLTLNVSLISVNGLAASGTSETFTLIDNQTTEAASDEGQFASMTGGSSAFTYTINYGQNVDGASDTSANDVTLTVTAAPEPTSFALLGIAGIGMLGRRRRKSRTLSR